MKTKTPIIQSMDYKEIIGIIYQERLLLEPSYSLRKFATDLQISSSTLSELLNNKHVPSIAITRKIAKCLKLTEEEAEHLVDLTLLVSPYGRDLRERALSRIKRRQRID